MVFATGNRKHQLKLVSDRYIRYLFITSAFLMTIIIASIIVFVGHQGLMTFKEVTPLEFFLSAKWNPTSNQFGTLSFISGSIYVTLLAVIIGAPLGLGGAIFMAKIAPVWLREIMRPATDLYVAIPSVVYGYIGLTIFVPFIRTFFDVPTGFGLFAAGIILSVMILPTIISISEDAIRAVPKPLEEASLALGATRWQTISRVLLPAALPGILTSIILAMARAIGETMAVQMVIGNTPQMAKSLFTPTSTLPSEIVVEMGNTPFGTAWGNSLFLMALVLLAISMVMILIIRRIAKGRIAY
ncbi:MAG TPA: phosphate ABC transporter permease subunit PstC [Methylomusa anaerophila]|uniref:Phosphate transport system permease protein n=1 Tax=Methylomusa anaerophila TaxID=1930071 RepID=A0A348AJJ3_9FIRM|nr:phosphate ABC transporter permease subunit PstC [Methylomusa anaerophila]BBB91241.1 phosphate transport system permease protein PstC [Methylomusa anaerophila]HML89765.1 phosphate ABC transporter permease subunit PstC [Methylomusa anaerophila]